jgi:uncharacterized protein (TIGR02588 family)
VATQQSTITEEVVPGVKGRELQASDATPLLEWIVAGVGVVLLSSLLIFLLVDALRNEPAKPDIVIQVQSISRTGGAHIASFKAINRGRDNAAAVVIAGELRSNGGKIEQSWVTLDYLPSGSEKTGGLLFTEDPHRYELAIRALGYVKP